MLVRNLMKILSNLFGNGSKIKYTEIGVPKDNKILNIKEYIDNGDVYSFNEVKTNKIWIDSNNVEHPIYRKVIDFGYLPNNTYREVDSGLSNVNICHMYGKATNSSNATITIPEASGGNTIRVVFTTDNKVQIGTTYDRTSFYGYVTLEYIKTTD